MYYIASFMPGHTDCLGENAIEPEIVLKSCAEMVKVCDYLRQSRFFTLNEHKDARTHAYNGFNSTIKP